MKFICVLLLLSLGCFAQDSKQDETAPTCVSTSFVGQVKRGLPFVQTIGSGLTYQIIPAEAAPPKSSVGPTFSGWTIRIAFLRRRGEMERDFSENMTPRYPRANARDLNTRYGRKVKEILAGNHEVYFVTTLFDAAEAARIMQMIRYTDEGSIERMAGYQLQRLPTGSAKFTILDQQLEGDPAAPTGFITLRFRVDLTVPTTVKLTPILASKGKSVACPIVPMQHLLTSPAF